MNISTDPIFALLSGQLDMAASLAHFAQLDAMGTNPDALVTLVQALRRRALPFPPQPQALDVCGTGGDGLNTPNISTAVAFVVAACGVPVVKHGNRAASSQSGSADVLEALGVTIEVPAEISLQALQQDCLCFLYARQYHPALRPLAAARKAFGRRTIFNLAGPLANPAQPGRQLVGVYDRTWLQPLAEALQQLGSQSVWVAHSHDGMDEISTAAPTAIAQLRNGVLTHFTVQPAEYGIAPPGPDALRGGNATENARQIRALLQGAPGAFADIVSLNTAAALVIADKATNIKDGLHQARAALANGAALAKLEQLIKRTVQA